MTNPELDTIAQQARAAYQAGDYTGAIHAYDQARITALDAGDEPLAAEMANNLSVAYLQDKQPEKPWPLPWAQTWSLKPAGDIAKQGMALGNIGTAYEELKKLEQAAEHYRRAIELLQQAGETEYRGIVQKSLAAIQIRQGKHMEGLFSMQQSFDGQKKLTPRERWLKELLQLPFKFLGK